MSGIDQDKYPGCHIQSQGIQLQNIGVTVIDNSSKTITDRYLISEDYYSQIGKDPKIEAYIDDVIESVQNGKSIPDYNPDDYAESAPTTDDASAETLDDSAEATTEDTTVETTDDSTDDTSVDTTDDSTDDTSVDTTDDSSDDSTDGSSGDSSGDSTNTHGHGHNHHSHHHRYGHRAA